MLSAKSVCGASKIAINNSLPIDSENYSYAGEYPAMVDYESLVATVDSSLVATSITGTACYYGNNVCELGDNLYLIQQNWNVALFHFENNTVVLDTSWICFNASAFGTTFGNLAPNETGDKVVIAYSSNGVPKCVGLSINKASKTITISDSVEFGISSGSSFGTQNVAFYDDNRWVHICLWGTYRYSSNNLVRVITFDGSTVTVGTSLSLGNGYGLAFPCIMASNSKIYAGYSSTGLFCAELLISETTLTLGNKHKIVNTVNSNDGNAWDSQNSCILLYKSSPNSIMAITGWRMYENGSYVSYNRCMKIDTFNGSIIGSFMASLGTHDIQPYFCVISESCIIAFDGSYANIIDIIDEKNTTIASTPNYRGGTSGGGSIILTSDNKLFIVAGYRISSSSRALSAALCSLSNYGIKDISENTRVKVLATSSNTVVK